MPMIIDYIDDIAKRTKRPALFLTFQNIPRKNMSDSEIEEMEIDSLIGVVDWHSHPSRNSIVRWLNKNKIQWKPCAGISSNAMDFGYQGQIYIDIPYDHKNPLSEQHYKFKRLTQFIEDGKGNVRWAGVEFHCLVNE